jgi:hypothetical protein
MYHNGSGDPMLFLDMDTVGKFNEIKNPGYTKEFMEFLTENLNLKMNRYFLKLAFNFCCSIHVIKIRGNIWFYDVENTIYNRKIILLHLGNLHVLYGIVFDDFDDPTVGSSKMIPYKDHIYISKRLNCIQQEKK